MRVLILSDELFASRERSLITRLEVGLADEGLRVVHATPDTLGELPVSMSSKSVTYSPGSLAATRRLAVRRTRRAIEALDDSAGEVDVVHVFGGFAWEFGRELASDLGAGLVLEVWRSGLVARAREWKFEAGDPPLLLAPDETIERALVDGSVGELTVRRVAWGVHAPAVVRPVLASDRALTVMVVGSGQEGAWLRAAIAGLGEVAKERPDMMIFCDASAGRRAGAWELARRLGLLAQVTMIEELESRRDLLVEGDVLILPEAHGEQRSVVLEAFASGMLVVAARDPMVSVLRDGQTCRLVNPGDERGWAAALREVTGDANLAAAITRQAHEFVARHRRASDHVRGVLAAYDWLAGDEPIPFKS